MNDAAYYGLGLLTVIPTLVIVGYYLRKSDPRPREISDRIYSSMRAVPPEYRSNVAEILRGLSELCPHGTIGGVEGNVEKTLDDFDL